MKRTQFRRGLAALAATALLAACGTSGDGGSQGSHKDGPSQLPGEGGPQSSDGKEVSVVDKGLTATSDSEGEPMASYAAILENPSHDIAGDIAVEIEVTDKNGEAIKDKVTGKATNSTVVYSIAPGERQPISNRTYLDDKGAESLSVEVTETLWYGHNDERFQPLTVSEPDAELADDKLELEFTVDSPYEAEVTTVRTYAVFRDESGDIVGGSSPNDSSEHRYKPGDTEGTIDITAGLPPDVDDSSIEMYVDASVKELK